LCPKIKQHFGEKGLGRGGVAFVSQPSLTGKNLKRKKEHKKENIPFSSSIPFFSSPLPISHSSPLSDHLEQGIILGFSFSKLFW